MSTEEFLGSSTRWRAPTRFRQHTTDSLRQTAIDAALWGMPIVSLDAMRQAFFRDAGARYGDFVHLSKPPDWRFQITTPSASTLYVYFNFNLRQGPVVLEVPPAVGAELSGTLIDAWQAPLVDVGPGGADAGAGGRYLLLPPGYEATTADGFIPVRVGTLNGYSVLTVSADGLPDDAARGAIRLVKRLRLYPLAQASCPPASCFIDMSGRLFDGVVRMDESYYESLARMVDEEPARPRDATMMESLKRLGIGKGRPFAPLAATRTLLAEAARRVHRELVRAAPAAMSGYWPSSQWGARPDDDGTDRSLVTLGAFFDTVGRPLSGERSYRLRVPPSARAAQLWTTTVYSSDTAAFIREAPRLEASSHDRSIERNADGSTDVFFGPKPPVGRSANWLATRSDARWFAVVRFHSPKQPLFDKSWRLPDIEEL